MKTLGEFYRERVLSQKGLDKREMPVGNGRCEVVKDLFGWKLVIDRSSVPCRSEAEARFLKVYVDAGMTEVAIPKDDTYLEQILPELERLKVRTDEIIESYLDTIPDRRVRERLRQEVFAGLLE